MKTIVKSFLFTAVLALVLTGCQKQMDNINVSLKSSVTPVLYESWFSGGGAAAECIAAESDCAYSFKWNEDPDNLKAGDNGDVAPPLGYPAEGAPNGTIVTPDGASITISGSNGSTFNWSSTWPVCAVIVKASTKALVYYYDGSYGDTGLWAPENKEVSHVTFCYSEPELCYEWKEETAWGGNLEGPIPINPKTKKPAGAWWFLYDGVGEETLWAGQFMNAGTVELIGSDIVITLAEGWYLQDVDEPVKIQGYNTGGIPAARPAAGLFTTYKGDALTIPVDVFDFYAIHLDVMKKIVVDCPVIEE